MSLAKVIRSAMKGEELLITPKYEAWLARHPNVTYDDEIAEWVSDQLVAKQRVRSGSFSASAAGKCVRRQVFAYNDESKKRDLNSDRNAIFHDGTFRHLRWQANLLQCGLIYDAEVPVVNDELLLVGTMDGIGRRDKDFGLEIKGARSGSYSYALTQGPMYSHVRQIHSYMIASGLEVFSLIYENKDTQEWKEYIINYDPDIASEVLGDLETMNKAVEADVLPPILDECKQKKGPYNSCPYAHICLKKTGPTIATRKIKVRRS